LIVSNSFCIVFNKALVSDVRKRFTAIKRYSKNIMEEEIKIGERNAKLFYFFLYGQELPVIHGICSETEPVEYSMANVSNGKLYLARDCAGTRPLYKSEGIVGTDHRLFAERFSLIAPRKIKKRKQDFSDENEIVGEIASRVEDSVKKRVKGRKKVCISFSGGLDSSIIAYVASKYTSVFLVSVFTKGAKDEKQARFSADKLDLPLIQVEAPKEEVEKIISRIDFPFSLTAMDKALYCIYNIASKEARELGCELILLGQMADELFGGYMKYLNSFVNQGKNKAEDLMRSDVKKLSEIGFIRDEVACSEWLIPSFPYSDEKIIEAALSLPFEYKIRGNVRKYILRKVGEYLCIHESIVGLEKKAAQYSSGIQKLVS